MAVYRHQVVAVGMWRGKIKRWNTTFHSLGSSDWTGIHSMMQALGYANPGDALGACSGGIASISTYNSTGGAPIHVQTYFDWQTPTTWIPYTGSVWSGIPAGTPLDASGESALVIVGKLSGLSVTGKPRSTRKYLHAIPSRTAAAYDDPDIDAATLALIQAQTNAQYWLTPAGQQPAQPTGLAFYGNHQRVRGRRRTTNQVAAQSFSAGVVAGTATGAAGAASPQ